MLELQRLSYQYPGSSAPALDKIDLSLNNGECVGLLGSNGAGKTTLLSLICGLLQPQQGTIVWHGQRSIGLVPQSLAFHANLRVKENLNFFADLYQLSGQHRKQQLELAIEAAALQQLLNQTAAKLSGGQQRRLNFALGLLQPAQLYLFDEATVGVDSLNRQRMLNSLRELARNDKTVIYTSHYLPEIEQLADRVILLAEGKLILDKPLKQQQLELNASWDTAIPAALVEFCLTQQLATTQQNNQITIKLATQSQLAPLLQLLSEHNPPIQLDYGCESLEQLYLQANGGQL